MRIHRGFILFSTLLFMQIYALLGLAALQQAFLAQKNLSAQKAQGQLWLYAQGLQAQLRSAQEVCLIPLVTLTELKTHSLSWWTDHACVASKPGFKSYYLVESLDHNPCVKVRHQVNATAAYYRLTVLVLKEHDDSAKLMLQSIMIQGEQRGEVCEGDMQIVDPGLQTWRRV